ncbi:MAG: S-methyl-5-thioribose-1-phosphate isomerase [Candidatus Diapherotrites archaeon]|uniref:R15P Isomerase n=3 Tax=Nanobdellati TaxID=1783276 RepID=A0A447IUB0_9ARCH|nr:S-methyl-5-thioribose-1-phosphate isomerase [Candidatus Diapherotrites archaeon]VDS11063.1 R15P Isomerase [uncultured DPANN archaeon]VDS11077.1 R15P Isomerase [uncultured DPANN archaeon]
MPGNRFKSIVRDIKCLKIQGASQVRKWAMKALRWSVRDSRARSLEAFRRELKGNAVTLLRTRPTEPELRTSLRIFLQQANTGSPTVPALKRLLLKALDGYEGERVQALKDVAENGLKVFFDNAVVFTHCHSHTVEAVLLKAWKAGKLKRVYCTETRPLFQGRITAANLAKHGVPVTLMVDGAAATYMKEADFFLSGADAVLEDGSVVNKVGTKALSLIAAREGKPHFVACSTKKFDPITYFGVEEKIEMRNPREVWPDKPGRVQVLNPAFDLTEARYVKGILTEKGVLKPELFALHMIKELELDKNKREWFSLIRLMK